MSVHFSPGGIKIDLPFKGKLQCPTHPEIHLYGCEICDTLKKANYQLYGARKVIDDWTAKLTVMIKEQKIIYELDSLTS